MKAELLEANHIYYVIISYQNSRTKSLLDFNGHRTLARQVTELINNHCPECCGIGGLHGEVIKPIDRSTGQVEVIFEECKHQNVIS